MPSSPIYYYLLYGGFFILSVLFSTLINGLFLKFSRTLGIRQAENVNIVRWASTAKPAVGGISFYILFLISASVYAIFRFSGYNEFNLQLVGLILSCSMGFLLGLADDAYNTVPWLKFAGQLICAVILVSTGIIIQLTDSFAINALFTVAWVVGIMNSINMLDNMDGVASIVAAIIMLGCLAFLAVERRFFTVQTFMMIGVIGAILGFLVYNFNPAKIYMGDTGSQFLGVFLSGLSIMFLWNHREPLVSGFQFKQLIIPSLAFVMPVMDTLTVFIHRIKKGTSPFVGGKDHTTHHLAYLGLTDKQVFFVIASLTAICNILAITAFAFFSWISSLGTFVILTGLVILFLFIQFVYVMGKPRLAESPDEKTTARQQTQH